MNEPVRMVPIEAIVPARELDVAGRCCGRKPLFYKTRRGMGVGSDPHHFCDRCCAEFGPDGKQRDNWAWKTVGSGFVSAAVLRALAASGTTEVPG